MSYKNCFTFNYQMGFRLIERGFQYLYRIKSITIEGNLITATIKGTYDYNVSALIDFENRTLVETSCTCPYREEHRYCKHIAALMLYADLYINGGTPYELENYYIAEGILFVLKEYERLSISPTLSNLTKTLINKSIHSTGFRPPHICTYSDNLSSVSEKRFNEALHMLEKNKIIKINKGYITILQQNFKKDYFYFFAKYSLLISYDNDDDEYEDGYYYPLEIEESNYGVDMLFYGPILSKESKTDIYLDVEDKAIYDEFDIMDIPNYHIENPPIPKIDLSNHVIEKIIYSYPNEQTKGDLIEKYENNKLTFDDIVALKDNNKKYSNIKNNYFIGKLVDICLSCNIPMYFKQSKNKYY